MKNVKVYRSLEEYTEDLSNSLHAEIKFENLTRAFFFFFLILGCVSVWYTFTWNLPRTNRYPKKSVRGKHQCKVHYVEPEIPLNQMHYELRFANAEKGLREDLLEDWPTGLVKSPSETGSFQDPVEATDLRETSAQTTRQPKITSAAKVKANQRSRSVLAVAATVRISGTMRRDRREGRNTF